MVIWGVSLGMTALGDFVREASDVLASGRGGGEELRIGCFCKGILYCIKDYACRGFYTSFFEDDS